MSKYIELEAIGRGPRDVRKTFIVLKDNILSIGEAMNEPGCCDVTFKQAVGEFLMLHVCQTYDDLKKELMNE